MNRRRRIRSWVSLLVLLLLPSLALAEVSVQLDAKGNYKRYWYLANRMGRMGFVWRQVRPNLPPSVVLNPLGDTLGDREPAIQVSPVTGYPWVVWPKNFGNITQLAFSSWDGKRWTEPALVHPGVPLVYEDASPSLALDAVGTLYLVWSRAEQTSKVYFSTMVAGRFTPALLISDADVDSRAPSIALQGNSVVIRYSTPAGAVTRTFEAALLVQSSVSLMDNPIPPLGAPPTSPTPDGGGSSTPGDIQHKR